MCASTFLCACVVWCVLSPSDSQIKCSGCQCTLDFGVPPTCKAGDLVFVKCNECQAQTEYRVPLSLEVNFTELNK